MINKNTRSYFHKLSELLLSVKVTNRNGAAISLDKGTHKAVEMLLSVKSTFKKAMLIGNGGSAAIASHIQNDFCKVVGVRAIVFNDIPLLTALSNDYGYDCVFERLIELWADTNDLLFAISSSGRSENILRAVSIASVRKCQIITLSGFNAKNPLRCRGELNFYVPSQAYGHVELVHYALLHFLTDYAESKLR